MTEWQPLETAPRDGTIILLACGDVVSLAFWHQTYDETKRKATAGWAAIWSSCPQAEPLTKATHWVPLPVPPTLEAA